MGLAKAQMEQRIDDITSFADIGEFIDQPVRTYSSGMFVRLAFAVAIHIDPEILVVDEALAVGDNGFQAKCLMQIDSIRKRGGTILIVTHALEQVAHHCDSAIVLDHARLIENTETPRALARYMSLLRCAGPRELEAGTESSAEARDEAADRFKRHPAYKASETRWGDRGASITDIVIVQRGLKNPETLIPGLTTEIRLRVACHAYVERPIYGLAIKAHNGAILFATDSRQLLAPLQAPNQSPGDVVNPCFKFRPVFRDGEYLISVGVASECDGDILPHDRRYDSIVLRIATPYLVTADIDMSPTFAISEEG